MIVTLTRLGFITTTKDPLALQKYEIGKLGVDSSLWKLPLIKESKEVTAGCAVAAPRVKRSFYFLMHECDLIFQCTA